MDKYDHRTFEVNWKSFTPRELDVIGLAALGYNNDDISEVLFLELNTTERYLTDIYDKFGFAVVSLFKRSALTYLAMRDGIVSPGQCLEYSLP